MKQRLKTTHLLSGIAIMGILAIGLVYFFKRQNSAKVHVLTFGSLISGAERYCEISDPSVVGYSTKVEMPRDGIDGIAYEGIEYAFYGLAAGTSEVRIYTRYPYADDLAQEARFVLTVDENLNVTAEEYRK